MNRKELIEKLMNVAENYKKGYLYGTGAITDIGVLVDEYTETVVKNCSIPYVVGRSEQLLDFIEWRKQVAVDDLTDKEIVEFYLARKVK